MSLGNAEEHLLNAARATNTNKTPQTAIQMLSKRFMLFDGLQLLPDSRNRLTQLWVPVGPKVPLGVPRWISRRQPRTPVKHTSIRIICHMDTTMEVQGKTRTRFLLKGSVVPPEIDFYIRWWI